MNIMNFVDWKRACSKRVGGITEGDIRKHAEYANFKLISRYKKNLSVEFIEEFKDELHWGELSCYQNFDGATVELFKDYIDFRHLSHKNIKMNEDDFLRKYKELIVYWGRYRMSDELIEELKDYIDFNSMFAWDRLSIKNIRKYEDKIDFKLIRHQALYRKDGYHELLRDFKDRMDWSKVSLYLKDENMLLEFCNLIDWKKVTENYYDKLSINIIRKFKDKLNWANLSQHLDSFIQIDNVIEFVDYIDWSTVRRYCSIDSRYKEKALRIYNKQLT